MVIKNELPKTELLKSDFYYDLPEELIAQTPVEPRDSSRLLLLDRETGEVRDSVFRDITEEIGSGDTLVINDSRVIPARLYGERTNGNATGPVEVLLLRQRGDDVWECLVKPGKRARPGHRIAFGGGALAFVLLAYVFAFALAAHAVAALTEWDGKIGKAAKICTWVGFGLLVAMFALYAVFTFSIPLSEGLIVKILG